MTDIMPGDIVVCVDTSPCEVRGTECPFAKGSLHRVVIAQMVPNDHGEMCLALAFEPNAKTGWNALWFRKIRPADPEFIEQVRVKEVERG